jgi:hypothetical protein
MYQNSGLDNTDFSGQVRAAGEYYEVGGTVKFLFTSQIEVIAGGRIHFIWEVKRISPRC